MSAADGVFDALRRAAGTALAMLQSRVELATLELGEAGQRLFSAALMAVFGVLMLIAAVVMLTVWVVMLLWDPYGPAVLAAFGVLYLLIAAVLWVAVSVKLRNQPPLLAATLDELRRDAAALRPPSGGSQAP